jgi:hypothetical protein
MQFFLEQQQELFPATVSRTEAPDFVMKPHRFDFFIGIEHTDVASQSYQRYLADTEQTETEEVTFFSPDGYVPGRSAELFCDELRSAISKKIKDKYWRNLRTPGRRLLLLYDMSDYSEHISHESRLDKINICHNETNISSRAVDQLVLVRDRDNVISVGGLSQE